MAKDLLRYDKMVEQAYRGIVREALTQTAEHGLPGAHHFYISFRTQAPGVEVPDHLVGQYPGEMTIVLEHQFWGLEIEVERFSVTLSFGNRAERLVVPFDAVTSFADPSVKFALQFQEQEIEPSAALGKPAEVARLGDLARSGEIAKPGEIARPREIDRPEEAAAPVSQLRGPAEARDSPATPAPDSPKVGEVITLDSFRKR